MADGAVGPRAGEWWTPGSDHRLAGILASDPDGSMRLELLGLLTDGRPFNEYPVVLGTVADGTLLTLESLRQVGRRSRYAVNREPVETETLAPAVAYLGAHLSTADDRTFDEATIEFTDLAVWAGRNGLDEKPGAEYQISVTSPPARVVSLPFGTLSLREGWGTTGDGVHARGFERSVWFGVTLKTAAPLEGFRSAVINPLRHFITFACDRPNEVSRLALVRNRADDRAAVEVEYEKASLAQSPPAAHAFDFLFDAPTLGAAFDQTLKMWFTLYSKIGPILNLYFGPRYRPGTFAENHFLNSVAAAEGYHRANFANSVLSDAEHRIRMSEVLGGAPQQHRGWLKERLAYSNEPPLRTRLEQHYARVPAGVVTAVIAGPTYAASVVRARNTLTHRGGRTRQPPISGAQLYRLTQQTNLLLASCILLDLGLTTDQVAQGIQRIRGYRFLAEPSVWG